jgi:hypothetical protein
MYQPGGKMCVALMRPDRPKFAFNNLMESTPEEIKVGFEGYLGYCGSYEGQRTGAFHHPSSPAQLVSELARDRPEALL